MIEVRDAGPTFWALDGLATTWAGSGKPYFISSQREGEFLEQVARGAFADAVGGRDSVELRLEHRDDSPRLAATSSNTLRFSDEGKGLVLKAMVRKSDPAARMAVAKIKSNAYSGLSVGMHVRGDRWSRASDGVTKLRTITLATLAEVSLVNRPANTGAQVLEIRGENGAVIEYRSIGIRPGRTEIPEGGVKCPACDGSGRQGNETCVVCKGFGWTDPAHLKAMKTGAVTDGTATSAGRSVDLELNALMARSDAIAAEAQLYVAHHRTAHPLPDLDYDAIRREGAALELEALALIAGKRSNRGLTTNRSF